MSDQLALSTVDTGLADSSQRTLTAEKSRNSASIEANTQLSIFIPALFLADTIYFRGSVGDLHVDGSGREGNSHTAIQLYEMFENISLKEAEPM